MQVRWTAVLTGFAVDYLLSGLVLLLAGAELVVPFLEQPDPSQMPHLVLMALAVAATGVGGYVAGRIAGVETALHGLLVGVVGVLLGEVATLLSGMPGPQRPIVIASVAGCVAGALGGWVARYVPPRREQA